MLMKMTKVCKTCKVEKSLDDFKDNITIKPDKKHWRCIECQESKAKERLEKHKEYLKKTSAERNKKYKENGYFKKRYQENREEIRAKQIVYALTHKKETHERYLKRTKEKVNHRRNQYGPFNSRICSRCKEIKCLNNFIRDSKKFYAFGFNYTCKPCMKIIRKERYKTNRSKHIKACKNWRENNPKSYRESVEKYNKSEKGIKKKQERRARLHNRILEACRTRINLAVKNFRMTKTKHTIEYLGCDIEFFIKHLESKFLLNMSWENYGFGMSKWNIDHIKPGRAFDLENNEKDREECFHYLNLQPLWQIDNFIKNDFLPNGERARNLIF